MVIVLLYVKTPQKIGQGPIFSPTRRNSENLWSHVLQVLISEVALGACLRPKALGLRPKALGLGPKALGQIRFVSVRFVSVLELEPVSVRFGSLRGL